MKKILFSLLFIPFFAFSQIHTITTSGMMFTPDTLYINVNDSVAFDLTQGTHNALSVDSIVWANNHAFNNGIFVVGYGVHDTITIFNTAQTYYYVCQSHVQAFGMKGVIIAQIPGCMDPTACNYDPSATVNDPNAPCTGIFGCMDITACTYDPSATCDVNLTGINPCNGLVGCMDPTSCDYDPSATCPSNSVTTAFCGTNWGCMIEPDAVNYDPSANCDDGTCVMSNFSSDTVCEGGPTQFTDLSLTGSSSFVTWDWDFGDGNTSAQQHPSHTYFICGEYYVTLQIEAWVNGAFITDTYLDTIEVLCPTSPVWIDDACESYTWWIGNDSIGTYTESTVDTSYGINAAGCLETNILNLTINGSSTYTNLTVCDSYTWPVTGLTYTTTDRYIDSSYNSFNCIHVDTLDLWVNSSTMNVETIDACESYTWIIGNDTIETYTSSVADTVVGTNPVGCPDTSILNLTINYADTAYVSDTACDSYTWNGQTYITSYLYGCCVGLQTVAGCDSVIWLDLTINYSTTITETDTACGSYTWIIGNDTMGIYTGSEIDTLYGINAAGCLETNILDITINYETTIDVPVDTCDTYTWVIGTDTVDTYTTSIVDSVISTNAAGCEETYILDLTLGNSSSTYTFDTACNSYYWITGFELYDTSGIYSLTTTNNDGCQHIDTLDLTINYSNSGSSLVEACDSYIWEGDTVTSSSTLTYTYVNGNAVGCDSTHTLMIDINYSNAGSSVDTACDSYLWNGTTYDSSGIYVDTMENVGGCDSIATLYLTINYSTTSLYGADSICDTYTWNGVTYDTSGTYTWVGVGANSVGCDSTATLNLIIRNSTTSTLDTIISCPDTSYIWNGTTYTSSGTYTYSTSNSVGCDSTATLNLTMNGIEYNIDSFFVCEDDTVVVGNVFYSIPGYFADTVNTNGCVSISGVFIHHYPETPLNPMTVPSPPEVCVGDSLVIEVNTGFDTYNWNTGNPLDEGENRVVVLPSQGWTIYIVEALDSNGCESREVIHVFADTCGPTSLTDNILTKIEVYPNPSQNVFNVDFNILQNQNVQLKVVNSIGDIVFTEYIEDYIGQYNTEIILDNHSKGIYLLQIITDQLIVNKKLILQ